MDITAEDFWEKLPDVLAIIAGADYVALDLEMTGVRVRDSLSTGEISVEQAYRRIRTTASTFSAIELGVTAIRWVECRCFTPSWVTFVSLILDSHLRDAHVYDSNLHPRSAKHQGGQSNVRVS